MDLNVSGIGNSKMSNGLIMQTCGRDFDPSLEQGGDGQQATWVGLQNINEVSGWTYLDFMFQTWNQSGSKSWDNIAALKHFTVAPKVVTKIGPASAAEMKNLEPNLNTIKAC